MIHWKGISEKYNKLVKLLKEKGIISELEVIYLFVEGYNESTHSVYFTITCNIHFPLIYLLQTAHLNLYFSYIHYSINVLGHPILSQPFWFTPNTDSTIVCNTHSVNKNVLDISL